MICLGRSGAIATALSSARAAELPTAPLSAIRVVDALCCTCRSRMNVAMKRWYSHPGAKSPRPWTSLTRLLLTSQTICDP